MWKVTQIAIKGRSHENSGTPCQDKTFSLNNNECFAVSLADGAGSAAHSEIGAQGVTKKVCEVLTEKFDEYFSAETSDKVAEELLAALIEELEKISAVSNCDLKDLASTLLAVAVKNDNFLAVHVGDGVIGMLDGDFLAVLSTPDNGEFSNETTFVTSPDAISHLRLYKGNIDEVSAFMLMSDGTASGFYQRQSQNLMPVMKKIIQAAKILPVEEVEKGLAENFRETLCKITADDCSLVLLLKCADESL
ncbi:MAG: protein phosphatase 2C domain-containing protein [Selenomonadaceae bacterium]|nr:protein phosphatase 2C domain-containing protein [Selenomonadaceae bacterium]